MFKSKLKCDLNTGRLLNSKMIKLLENEFHNEYDGIVTQTAL